MKSKSKPKKNRLNIVTPFSRTVTAILFLAIPLILFFIGINYGRDLERIDSTYELASKSEQAAMEAPAPKNSILVDTQTPGKEVTVRSAIIDGGGYVVIYRADAQGMPGKVIGKSAFIESDAMNVVIPLTEAVASGDRLVAGLNVDDGDTVFEFPGADAAVTDAAGNPVVVSFSVSE
ncbi:MAG: hypothetical protein N2691_05075 [Patescibacteria group bacterium]|nr:hypothetical protein [Patescibacteria group bacterium]